MGRRVIDGCHEAIWARLDRLCGIYGASSADRWASGSPALCFSLRLVFTSDGVGVGVVVRAIRELMT